LHIAVVYRLKMPIVVIFEISYMVTLAVVLPAGKVNKIGGIVNVIGEFFSSR